MWIGIEDETTMKDFIFLIGIGFMLGFGVANGLENYYWRATTVEHGCAHYDTQTGKWQWNKEAAK